MSDVMVCEGRAFRRRLGRKDRALMNGTRVLFFCFFKHFLMWTIFFKFVTILFLFCFGFWLQGMWDPTSPPETEPTPPEREGTVLITGPPGKSLDLCSFKGTPQSSVHAPIHEDVAGRARDEAWEDPHQSWLRSLSEAPELGERDFHCL